MKLFCSAKLLIVTDDKKVLVLIRSGTHPRTPHTPDLPGGHVHDDEASKAGVLRELFEETGIRLDSPVLTLVDRYTEYIPDADLEVDRFLYRYTLPSNVALPKVTISWEHDSYQWVPLSELKIRPSLQQQIDRAKKAEII